MRTSLDSADARMNGLLCVNIFFWYCKRIYIALLLFLAWSLIGDTQIIVESRSRLSRAAA